MLDITHLQSDQKRPFSKSPSFYKPSDTLIQLIQTDFNNAFITIFTTEGSMLSGKVIDSNIENVIVLHNDGSNLYISGDRIIAFSPQT